MGVETAGRVLKGWSLTQCYLYCVFHICYPQKCGRMISRRVPDVTGHRQSREGVKYLSNMANHSSLTSPPGSVLF